MTHTRRGHRALSVLLGTALTVLLALVGVAGTSQPAQAADTGWLRLTHLSPDTPDVNVALTSVSDSRVIIRVPNVGYGDMSPYAKVAAGRYVASMTPAGGNGSSEPAVSQPVTVKAGRAYTVAAMGDNAHLRSTVLTDDLTPARSGRAKVRVLQAATSASTATVSAQGGAVLTPSLKFGRVTSYADVDARPWMLIVDPHKGQPVTRKVTLSSASTNTVILLDDGHGRITTKLVRDAAGVASASNKDVPRRGVQTGGGGLALSRETEARVTQPGAPAGPLVGVLAAAMTTALAVSVVVVRRRRA